MLMRDGFALTLALGLVLSGCASSGGGTTTAAAPAGPVGSGATLLTQGERPRETDNTDAAQEALEAAAEAEEDGNAAAAASQYQLALQASQAAITEDATNPLAYLVAGYSALGLDDYPTAGQHFDRAIELRPLYELDLAPVRETAYLELYQEATPHLQGGAYLEAAAILENANLIYPARPEALITLAQIYAQERQHDRAVERIDQAIAFLESDALTDVDSATVAAWRADGENLSLMRGQVLADAGRFEEAAETYRGIIAADPNNIVVTQDLAAILMLMNREPEAIAVYDQLLARPGLTGLDYYRIGVGFYNASDYGRAADAFGRGVAISSRDRDGLEMWARSLQLDSAYTAVPPVAERWIALDPSSQIAHAVLAQSVNASGNAQAAAEVMRRVESLFATVDDLEMRRGVDGSVVVGGSVANRNMQDGDRVTLTFTFYSESGQAIGNATHQATVGAAGAKVVFQVQFQSTQPVGGYGYTIARG